MASLPAVRVMHTPLLWTQLDDIIDYLNYVHSGLLRLRAEPDPTPGCGLGFILIASITFCSAAKTEMRFTGFLLLERRRVLSVFPATSGDLLVP
jgi:hypothetical protein